MPRKIISPDGQIRNSKITVTLTAPQAERVKVLADLAKTSVNNLVISLIEDAIKKNSAAIEELLTASQAYQEAIEKANAKYDVQIGLFD